MPSIPNVFRRRSLVKSKQSPNRIHNTRYIIDNELTTDRDEEVIKKTSINLGVLNQTAGIPTNWIFSRSQRRVTKRKSDPSKIIENKISKKTIYSCDPSFNRPELLEMKANEIEKNRENLKETIENNSDLKNVLLSIHHDCYVVYQHLKSVIEKRIDEYQVNADGIKKLEQLFNWDEIIPKEKSGDFKNLLLETCINLFKYQRWEDFVVLEAKNKSRIENDKNDNEDSVMPEKNANSTELIQSNKVKEPIYVNVSQREALYMDMTGGKKAGKTESKESIYMDMTGGRKREDVVQSALTTRQDTMSGRCSFFNTQSACYIEETVEMKAGQERVGHDSVTIHRG